jgi:hypothetical protein
MKFTLMAYTLNSLTVMLLKACNLLLFSFFTHGNMSTHTVVRANNLGIIVITSEANDTAKRAVYPYNCAIVKKHMSV